MQNTFTFGVNPGGLREKQHIKVLICYLLFATKRPMTKSDIIKVLQENDLANYFEANSAFSELIDLKRIEEKNKKIYITESGEIIAKELENDIPVSVREKAIKAALDIMSRFKIESENKVKIQKIKNGYETILEISGGEFNLMSITLYTPSIEQANLVKKNFHNNPELFYKCFFSLATENKIKKE